MSEMVSKENWVNDRLSAVLIKYQEYDKEQSQKSLIIKQGVDLYYSGCDVIKSEGASGRYRGDVQMMRLLTDVIFNVFMHRKTSTLILDNFNEKTIKAMNDSCRNMPSEKLNVSEVFRRIQSICERFVDLSLSNYEFAGALIFITMAAKNDGIKISLVLQNVPEDPAKRDIVVKISDGENNRTYVIRGLVFWQTFESTFVNKYGYADICSIIMK